METVTQRVDRLEQVTIELAEKSKITQGEVACLSEVKSSPNRKNYIEEFIEKLKLLPEFMPDINHYRVVPIYAGLSMDKSAVEALTEKGIYAMVVKGDILEIVNFEDLKIIFVNFK